MIRWQEVRQLAAIIEDEAEGRQIDRGPAVELARRLARKLPHIEASMAVIVRRLDDRGPSSLSHSPAVPREMSTWTIA